MGSADEDDSEADRPDRAARMATTSLLRLPLQRLCSGSIGEERRHLRWNSPAFHHTLWVALRWDTLNSPLAKFMKPAPVVAMASPRLWMPTASLQCAAGSIDGRFRNCGTTRRVLHRVGGARSGGRGRCCTGTSNVGPETSSMEVQNIDDVVKDLDSTVTSPVDRVEQGSPEVLRHSLEDGRDSVSGEVFRGHQ